MDTPVFTGVGGFYAPYDGHKEVSIAFVIKHNIYDVLGRAYQYLDNKCQIVLNGIPFIGTPYMGKITQNKYVMSIVFGKAENEVKPGELLQKLAPMAMLHDISITMEVIEANAVKRIDPQFWEKIKKVLRTMAGFYGSPDEWEYFRGYVKREYNLKFTVGPSMEAADAEMFYDLALEYASKNEIPLKTEEPMLRDIENYLTRCRQDNKCCVCGAWAANTSVYPLCQDHFDEYMELGKTGFDHKHKF